MESDWDTYNCLQNFIAFLVGAGFGTRPLALAGSCTPRSLAPFAMRHGDSRSAQLEWEQALCPLRKVAMVSMSLAATAM